MASFRTRLVVSALVAAGVASATGVSLSTFTPRESNLPSQCQSVYTTPIEGCVASDFTNGRGICSAGCVNGLVKITKAVQESCADINVRANSPLGVFLRGNGLKHLCSGTEIITISSSSSQPSSTTTSSSADQSPEATPTSPPNDDDDDDDDEDQQTTSPSATSTGGIAIDTSVPSNVPSFRPQSSNASPSPQETTSSQKSNADSGGGSPFDVTATGSAAPRTALQWLSVPTVVGTLAMLFASI